MIEFTFKSIFLLFLLTTINGSFEYKLQATILPISEKTLSPSELYQQGLQHFETQEYPQAIETLLTLIKIEPDNFQAYNIIGMSFGGLQEYPAAIAALDRAIALQQDFANAYYNRGYVYQQLNRYDLALENFNQVIELTQGEHVSALINRSSIYALQADYSQALADLQQVIELNPELAIAYYNRALVYLTIDNQLAYLDDLATAEKIYRQVEDTSGLRQINRLRNLY